MTFNEIKLNQVIEAAKSKTTDPTWLRAIERAAEQLRTNPYISEQDGGLLILGTTGEIYHANGSCQCKAYRKGMNYCWHRVAAKLVRRYNEMEAAPAASTPRRDYCGDRDLQHLAHCKPHVSTRQDLERNITEQWEARYPSFPIWMTLRKFYGVNSLAILDTNKLNQLAWRWLSAPC